jgi:hypothetical protein
MYIFLTLLQMECLYAALLAMVAVRILRLQLIILVFCMSGKRKTNIADCYDHLAGNGLPRFSS